MANTSAKWNKNKAQKIIKFFRSITTLLYPKKHNSYMSIVINPNKIKFSIPTKH